MSARLFYADRFGAWGETPESRLTCDESSVDRVVAHRGGRGRLGRVARPPLVEANVACGMILDLLDNDPAGPLNPSALAAGRQRGGLDVSLS
jgi:hypothetical protein